MDTIIEPGPKLYALQHPLEGSAGTIPAPCLAVASSHISIMADLHGMVVSASSIVVPSDQSQLFAAFLSFVPAGVAFVLLGTDNMGRLRGRRDAMFVVMLGTNDAGGLMGARSSDGDMVNSHGSSGGHGGINGANGGNVVAVRKTEYQWGSRG